MQPSDSQVTQKIMEVLKGKMVIFVTSDSMSVVIQTLNYDRERLAGKSSIVHEDVSSYIERNKITARINEEAVKTAIDTQDDTTQCSYIIARGKNVTPGKSREIKILFSDKPSVILAFASKNSPQEEKISNLKQVKKGELIGEENPPVPPQYGTNVFGIPVPAPKLKDESPLPNENIIKKENKLYANINGILYLSKNGKEINIFPLQIVEKKLDELKKSISFNGVIIIRGIINKCSPIKCNVLVCQELNMTDIETTDDIIVVNKISNSTIKCGGSIYANEVFSSNINTKNDVIAVRTIGKSEIVSDGKVICSEKGIYGSRIKAKYFIDTWDLGDPKGGVNEVSMGGDSQFNKKVVSIQKKIEGYKTNKVKVENKFRLEHAKLRGQFPLEEVDQHKPLVILKQLLLSIDHELKALEGRKNVLLKSFNKSSEKVYIRVRGVGVPGNIIRGVNSYLTMKTFLKGFQAVETLARNDTNETIPKYEISVFSLLQGRKI